jgi:hypothetical protein
MPIFYLEPIDEQRGHPRWAATSLAEGCWVYAPDAETARRMVEMATIKMVDMVLGREKLYSPWLDPKLTECRRDDSAPIKVPEDGIIVTRTGRTIP